MQKNSHYRIVLADDHALVRRWLRKIIEKNPQLQVIGEVGDGLELLEFLKKRHPEMILLDISMPKLGGLEAARIIKQDYPKIKVLILTMHKNKIYLEQAMLAGVAGYLVKEEADQELLPAIATLREGKTYISPLVS
jgi:two-component system response regulator NreC